MYVVYRQNEKLTSVTIQFCVSVVCYGGVGVKPFVGLCPTPRKGTSPLDPIINRAIARFNEKFCSNFFKSLRVRAEPAGFGFNLKGSPEASFAVLFCCVDHQCHVAGAFDVHSHCALVLGAVASDAAGQDFAALGHEIAQFGYVFVVYSGYFFLAELAHALFAAASAFIYHTTVAPFGFRAVRVPQ
jgi:hypothetical protein